MSKFFGKVFYLFLTLLIVVPLFIPSYEVKASSSYSVVMVSNSTNNKTVGTYSSYSEALKVMNSQNSTSTSVASIYKNGKIINSRYAIFQFYPNTGTVNLYQNASDFTAYTYTNPSSMTDAAFIDSNESRVQIMLNGFKGWVDINAGTIIPISLLGSNAVSITASGLRLRSSASTSSSSIGTITCSNAVFSYTEKTASGGYTWYKINYNGKEGWVASGSWLYEVSGNSLNTYYYRYSTGNLLHRYAYHNGTSYTDNFTNLGPTPSYLTEGVHYYSFDGGIYLYNSLTSMLDDYRDNNYSRSINASNPNYAYYLYLPSKSVSRVTASELDSQITNTSSKLYGQGKYFKEAEKEYGMNALSAFATAKNESASGTSDIAKNKNNVFGYGASDSCPYSCAYSYASVRDSIMDYAKNGLSSYMIASAKYYFGTHSGNKGSGRNVKYASDPLWGEKQASNAFITDKKNNLRDYNANTIGVTKFGKSNVLVYSDSSGSKVLYTIQNSNSSFKVYNVPMTVLDKVGDYYKVYADSTSSSFGYVKKSDLNVSNSQPTINASDKTILLNSSFNYMEGVSAYDNEDGNLTSSIKYSGTVDTSKAGVYTVTYTVTDNSNFSFSKDAKITVKGSSNPIINASDKEVSQYTDFNYMEGVSASDDSGDLTGNVTYSETVDTNSLGTYKVTYTVTNKEGKSTSKIINVKVVLNEKPVIEATDKTVYLNHSFDELEGVKASDREDGDITSSIKVVKNDVKTDTIGDYEVTYSVADKAGQEVTKTIKVSVIQKELKETEGISYLDYIKNVSGKLEIKGYNTILGINNTLDTNISYKVLFENVETGEISEQDATRVTDKSLMTKPIYSFDGKDYTYSWYMLDVDLSALPEGNYKMYIVSSSEDYYSKSVISNKLNKTQDGSFSSSSKNVIIRSNYSYDNSPVELVVRNKKLASKNASSYYNQFDKYVNFEFTTEGKLHLRGMSYSYGANLGTSANVSRKIIFENMETFDTYTKDLGSITDGNYSAILPESDNLDKTRAWYDKNIDISDIPKGKYVIYITTTSNITDIYEFTEKLNRSLDDVKADIDGKSYSFKINYDRGNRIEMTVK